MTIKKIINLCVGVVILAGISSLYVPERQDTQEYVLKAAFLYRFIDYVEWENNNKEQNFTIAILGESGIIAPLSEIARDKKAKNKRIEIKKYENINDLPARQTGGDPFQVLFISQNYNGEIEPVITKTGDRAILVITEKKDACEKGAHINFLIAENKLKFEVNLKAASRSNLKISSQLLQHAILVNTP